MKKINEIFYSIQGEGFFTGTPAVFVRFSGCNLKCPYCDTEHEPYKEMTDAQIVAEILKYPGRHIVLTGGEPSLQVDKELCVALQEHECFLQMETNGTVDVSHLPLDWITYSPKGKITQSTSVMTVNELKVVYTGQDMSMYDNINAWHFYLQPCSCQNTDEVINYIKQNPEWKLSLQTQKLLKIQ